MLIEPGVYQGPICLGNDSGTFCTLEDVVKVVHNRNRFIEGRIYQPLQFQPEELLEKFKGLVFTEHFYYWDGKSEQASSDQPIPLSPDLFVSRCWYEDMMSLIQCGVARVERLVISDPNRIEMLLESFGRRKEPGLLRLDAIDPWGGFNPIRAIFGYDQDEYLFSPRAEVYLHIPPDIEFRG